MSKKVLLTNAYAVNNGDMALALALSKALQERGFDVTIATFYSEFLKQKYPALPLLRELLDVQLPIHATIFKKMFLQLNFMFNKEYRSFDYYIACPGGYMNSYYGLKKCLLPLVEAKKRNKKTAVYSQSVGPLNNRDKKLLTKYSKSIDVIVARDNFSVQCINSTPCHSEVLQTKDAAFLLKPRRSMSRNSKLVAVSVRSWKHDQRSMQHYVKMVQAFCLQTLKEGYDIEFISTCQGVEGYVDDSKVAIKIKESLVEKHPEYSGRITVDADYHTYFELVELLNSRYSFTIGTRLHMCILSLINGTPAFNISYEVKGMECYKYLDLENYSVDFNAPIEKAKTGFSRFLMNYQSLQTDLIDRLMPVYQESHENLDKFLEMLNEK